MVQLWQVQPQGTPQVTLHKQHLTWYVVDLALLYLRCRRHAMLSKAQLWEGTHKLEEPVHGGMHGRCVHELWPHGCEHSILCVIKVMFLGGRPCRKPVVQLHGWEPDGVWPHAEGAHMLGLNEQYCSCIVVAPQNATRCTLRATCDFSVSCNMCNRECCSRT